MQGWWFASFWEMSPVLAVGWAVWVIVSIVLHELAHGWAAIRLGDTTPIDTGHMTWNPLVHMGAPSLVAFAILGIAWGLMPISPSRLRGRYGDAVVAIAGPIMNLSLAVLCIGLTILWVGFGGGQWTAWSANDVLFGNTMLFLFVGVALNLFLAVFNLIPVPPLDGSRVLASYIPAFARVWEGPSAGILALIVFAALFFVGSQYIFGFAFGSARFIIDVALDAAFPTRP